MSCYRWSHWSHIVHFHWMQHTNLSSILNMSINQFQWSTAVQPFIVSFTVFFSVSSVSISQLFITLLCHHFHFNVPLLKSNIFCMGAFECSLPLFSFIRSSSPASSVSQYSLSSSITTGFLPVSHLFYTTSPHVLNRTQFIMAFLCLYNFPPYIYCHNIKLHLQFNLVL